MIGRWCVPSLQRATHPVQVPSLQRATHPVQSAKQTRINLALGVSHALSKLTSFSPRRSFCDFSEVHFAKRWPITYLTRAEVAKKFEKYDLDGDGFITIEEIFTVLFQLGEKVTDEISNEMRLMDTNCDGKVDYHEFVHYWLGANQETPQSDEQETPQSDDQDKSQIDYFGQSAFSSTSTLLEYISSQSEANMIGGASRETYLSLVERFKALDEDGDGLLSPTELFNGLSNEHPTFSPRQIGMIVQRMLREVDKDRSGSIDFYEFVSQFLDPNAVTLPQLELKYGTAIEMEETPNPATMKFIPVGHDVLGAGTKTRIFRDEWEASDSPLVVALFKVNGVQQVMLAGQHLTVTKSAQAEWGDIEEEIHKTMSHFFMSGLEIIKAGAHVELEPEIEPGSIEEQILELLEERVKPFVQQDGGDIEFDHFDKSDGSLYLIMQGSCAGCAQSHVTLQEGVKNLMDHFIPEVKQIVGIHAGGEEEIPRARS